MRVLSVTFRLFLLVCSSLEAFAQASPGRDQVLSRPLALGAEKDVGFLRLDPESTGIQFTNTLSESSGAANRTLYNGSGVATGDIDADGKIDLVFAGLENQLAIFKNLGDWRFTNWTAHAGVKTTNAVLRGVVLADIDGNQSLDLLVTANNRGVLCWLNDGRGKFTVATKEAGTGSAFGSTTLALADVDGNGSLDLYVANNRSEDIRDRGEVQLNIVGGRPAVPAQLRNRLVLFRGQILEFGEPDALLLNNGRGQFRPAQWTSGMFLDENGLKLPGAPLDWGLTAAFRDLNGDQAPDLYVCNDFWTPDRIWLNDGAGNFRAARPLAFRHTSGSSMGVDMADLNFDGTPEIFVLDMLSRSFAWRKRQADAQPPSPNPPGLYQDRPQILRNTLHLARSDGTYAEIANFAGVAASEWAWQPVFIDVDLDGHLDLLITTGHAHDVQDRDANVEIQRLQRNYQAIRNPEERRRVYQADLLAHMKLYPELRTPIVAYRNQGNLKFEEVTAQWGTETAGIHHGIATADFDGDGDLDFVVNNLNEAAAVYRNVSAAPRVAVRLKGKSPNTQAVGGVVTLRHGAVPKQQMEISAGGRYLSGSDPLAVFAAGNHARPMTLEIAWRDGTTTTVSGVLPNHYYEVEGTGAGSRRKESSQPLATNRWFTDVGALLGHSHFESQFDDFARQALLPHRLSQLGPGVCWSDFDADGWEDLAIGTEAGGFLGVYRNNQNGTFTRWTNAPFHLPVPRDTTALISVALPDGSSQLLAGLASYEDARTNAAALFRYGAKLGGPIALLPDLPSSVGPIVTADYDADGDLDLFVGSRVIPGKWPQAGGSVLLQNDRGSWTPRSMPTNALARMTPVGAALWTDLTGDGFPELVTAGEFAPITIHANDRGNLSNSDWDVRLPSGGKIALGKLTGWWTSLASGDIDGDGTLDLIAGNWGENSEYRASPEQPHKIFTGTFGLPSLAIIETAFDPELNDYVPIRPLDDYLPQLPFLLGKYASHQAYSTSSVEQVLGPARAQLTEWNIAELRSVVLLNRRTHFELRPLPPEAQFAPVFGISVADFDLNGRIDLFLAQNFFATRPGVPRLNGGRGLMLQGDGKGEFQPVPGEISGIEVYGEQRGAAAADFDHDGRVDLVVTQNGAQTKLFRNTSAAQGLRVQVVGPPGNPRAVGTFVRLKTAEGFEAGREIKGGSGYWSQDAATAVLALPTKLKSDEFLTVEIRWPGGRRREVKVPNGLTELEIEF